MASQDAGSNLPPPKRGKQDSSTANISSISQTNSPSTSTTSLGKVSLDGHKALASSSSQSHASTFSEGVPCGSPLALLGSSPLKQPKQSKQLGGMPNSSSRSQVNSAPTPRTPGKSGSLDGYATPSSSSLHDWTGSHQEDMAYSSPSKVSRTPKTKKSNKRYQVINGDLEMPVEHNNSEQHTLSSRLQEPTPEWLPYFKAFAEEMRNNQIMFFDKVETSLQEVRSQQKNEVDLIDTVSRNSSPEPGQNTQSLQGDMEEAYDPITLSDQDEEDIDIDDDNGSEEETGTPKRSPVAQSPKSPLSIPDTQENHTAVVRPSFSEIISRVRRANQLQAPPEQVISYESEIFMTGNSQKTKPPPIYLPWSRQTQKAMNDASTALARKSVEKSRWLSVPVERQKRFYSPSEKEFKAAVIPDNLPGLLDTNTETLLKVGVHLSGRESRELEQCLGLSLAANSWLERILASVREFLPALQPQEECDLQALLESSSRALRHQAALISTSWANVESRRRDSILGDPSDTRLKEIYTPLKKAPLLDQSLIPSELVETATTNKNQMWQNRAIVRAAGPPSRSGPSHSSTSRPSNSSTPRSSSFHQKQPYHQPKKEEKPSFPPRTRVQKEKPRPFPRGETKRTHHKNSGPPRRKF